MRIQHNIPAMSSYRNYTNNVSALSKNLEKLSSGYKINRAGDDAAGLAISEKMRIQITGLEVAQKNAKDGISLVQTAEGALTEVHDMLNRMYELAEQSANGTYDDEVDRNQLNKEVTKLKEEIDRIADSCNFNGIKLLDGSLNAPSGALLVKNGIGGASMSGAGVTASGGVKFKQTLTINVPANDWTNGDIKEGDVGRLELSCLDKNGEAYSTAIKFKYGADTNTTTANMLGAIRDVFGADYNVTLEDDSNVLTIEAAAKGKDDSQILSAKIYRANGEAIVDDDGKSVAVPQDEPTAGKDDVFALDMSAIDLETKNYLEIDGKKFHIVKRGKTADDGYTALYTDTGKVTGKDEATQLVNQLAGMGIKADVDKDTPTTINIVKSNGNDGDGGLVLQIGDTAESFNKITVGINDCHCDALGISSVDITTQEGAAAAMARIKTATNMVSDVRGGLGATQNRLDHTIKNLSVMQQNIQDAESTIRDVDIAAEMMEYTKNSILVQSAQAMLAQSNQLPQGVLQLLQ